MTDSHGDPAEPAEDDHVPPAPDRPDDERPSPDHGAARAIPPVMEGDERRSTDDTAVSDDAPDRSDRQSEPPPHHPSP
ncbi:hypothetical protein, partial [Nonomuraea aridisoli]|uniref:hypothetical protein n=1 Tax=Nonomuraea aridisoli TaxID=2070368 RepID=UPI003F6962BB